MIINKYTNYDSKINTYLLLSKISFESNVSNDSTFCNLAFVDPICKPNIFNFINRFKPTINQIIKYKNAY